MLARGARLTSRLGVEPRAGRELDDAPANVLARHRGRHAGAPVVEYAHCITGRDAARRRIFRMHRQRLAAADLAGAAVPAVVELAAEPEEAFGQEHERTYGHRAGPDEPLELVNIQVVGYGVSDRSRVPGRIVTDRPEAGERPAPRSAYFGARDGWLETPVLFRADLETPRAGPAIIEEYDATCVIPPRARTALDACGNIVIDLP